MSQLERFSIRDNAGRWQWPGHDSETEDEDDRYLQHAPTGQDYEMLPDEEQKLLILDLSQHEKHIPRTGPSDQSVRPLLVCRRTMQRTLTSVATVIDRRGADGDEAPVTDELTSAVSGSYTGSRAGDGKNLWTLGPGDGSQKSRRSLDLSVNDHDIPKYHSMDRCAATSGRPSTSPATHCCCTPWILATGLLLFVVLVETAWLLYHPTTFLLHKDSLPVWPTLPPHLLQYTVDTRYTSALHAHENGTLFIANPSPFIGPASPELDERWAALIEPRYFRLTDSEIVAFEDEPPALTDHDNATAMVSRHSHLAPLPSWPPDVNTPGVYAGVDMLHSLHCVNALRFALSASEGYDAAGAEGMGFMLPGETRELHLWHCIDQLRQAVLCHGDVTPVPLRPVISGLSDGTGRIGLTMLGETERVHQCRDWEGIGAWVKDEAEKRGWV